MNTGLFRLSALGLALASSYAGAVGFGEIVLHSRVGEVLRAEVPLLAGPDDAIETACFSLSAMHGAELPVVSSARIRLVRNGSSYRLLISGNRPVSEPVFVIGVRATCGFDLQRDYVLMPSAPVMLASGDDGITPPTVSPAPRKSADFREWRAQEGDTLAAIAESQAPDSAAGQRRLLAALKRANPNILADEPLTDGTLVRIPNLRQRPPAQTGTPTTTAPRPHRTQSEEPPPAKPKKLPKPAARSTPADMPGDRLVLGKPPAELQPGESAVPARANLSEMEERMLKLETTLHSLNQEVDKLNSALALTTEALAVQNKIQAAQAAQAAPDTTPAIKASVATPPASEPSSRNNWLELLLSALVGGGLAAGMAHMLSRNRPRPGDDELPLAIAGYHPEIQVHPTGGMGLGEQTTPSSQVTSPASLREASAVDIPLDATTSGLGGEATVDVDYSAGGTALELAEIMLSFGRVRGAAETLAQHIEESSPENIQPWSMLLDLYRRGGMRAEFDSLAASMQKKFNVHVPSWAESSTPVSGLKALEDYAHIVWRAANSWGTQECLNYLYELVHDTRAGQRSGFPLEVVEEIALLMRILEDAYGLKRPD